MSVSQVGSPRLSASGSGSDTELERSLFQLMGKLEQVLVRVDSLPASKKLPGSIEIAKEILVELVEFSDERFDQSQTGPVIDQVCDFHEATKRFEKMLGGQSWNGFAAFIGIKMSYSDEIKLMFQQLGQDMLAVVGGFFALFESHFQSGDQATEWKDSAQVFLDDLVRRWNIDGEKR